MSYRYYDAVDWFFFGFFGLMGTFLFLAIFYVVLALKVEANCLEKGYPRSAVTWNMKEYCMNLEGTVTVEVLSLSDKE